MNTLSWLIYAANVVENISAVTTPFLFFSMMGIIASVLLTIFCIIEDSAESIIFKYAKRSLVICAVVGCLFTAVKIITPSRNTVLLIAASEMGERVAATPRVQEVLDPASELLQTWMRQQTEAIRAQQNRDRR